MIKGIHAMFYSSKAEELRSFLRDKLELRSFDIGGGWLIFDLPGAEVGCHPVDLEKGRNSGAQHVSFYCDDIRGTVAELSARGVEFTGPITETEWGFAASLKAPGDFEIVLFQPRYEQPSWGH